MNFHFRYIGDALAQWERAGIPPRNFSGVINPAGFHVGDFITHSDFPDRWLVVRARHFDLTEPGLTLYIDLHPEPQSSNEWPRNVAPLFPSRE